MHLSVDQRRSLEIGDPVRGQDGGLEFVILRADLFEQIKALLPHEDDWSVEEARALGARTMDDADSAGPIS